MNNRQSSIINRQWSFAVGRWSLVVALAAIFWLFIPPYQGSFIGDDYIQLNRITEFLDQPQQSWQIFLPNWQAWYYRPLQNFVFLGNWLIYDLNPFGHYIGLILWHLLATALLYQLGRRLGLTRGMATAVALLFAIHGHYHDVVTWLSAVAIVMVAAISAAGLILFAIWLNDPERRWPLAAALAVFLVGLVAHEEAFLLPVKMGCLWLLYPRQGKGAAGWCGWLAARRRELTDYPALPSLFGLMGAAMAGYLYLQWARPNLNVNLREGATLGLAQIVDPTAVSAYLVQIGVRTTAVFTSYPNASVPWIAVGLILLLGLWFWRANWLGRFGLLWWGLHIAFIYGALWIQRPEFLGGRHLYNGNMGLALALGAAAVQLQRAKWAPSRRELLRVGLPALLAAVLLTQAVALKQKQQIWLGIAENDRRAEIALREMMPELTDQTRVFAHRFAIDVTYMEGVLKVWYDRPELRGFSGRLTDLRQWGWLPDGDTYLLDYANRRLVNLMPQLQTGGAYLLLWAGGPQPLTVTGPPDDQRLAVSARLPDEANQWQPLTYRLVVSDGAALHMAAGYGFAGQTAATSSPAANTIQYRIRLTTNGETITLYEGVALPNEWRSHSFPLDAYAPGEITVLLEQTYSGERPSAFYWANPHLSR